MQMNRLFELVYLLLEKEKIKAKDLADRFEVSTRTIYRDVETLSQAGIPIFSLKGKDGGICLMPNFVLNKSFLTEREQDEILFALQSLKATRGMEEDEMIPRLKSLFKRDGVDWIDVEFTHWGSGEEEQTKFRLLKYALLNNRVLTFTYYSANGEKKRRKVEPMKLVFKYGSWYLVGYSLERNAFRTFKTNRMDHLTVTEEVFQRIRALPEPLLPEEPWGEHMELKLRFKPHMAFRVLDEFPKQDIKEEEDGSFLVKMAYPKDVQALPYLLTFGDGVEVMEPECVRQWLKKKAENIASFY